MIRGTAKWRVNRTGPGGPKEVRFEHRERSQEVVGGRVGEEGCSDGAHVLGPDDGRSDRSGGADDVPGHEHRAQAGYGRWRRWRQAEPVSASRPPHNSNEHHLKMTGPATLAGPSFLPPVLRTVPGTPAGRGRLSASRSLRKDWRPGARPLTHT